MCWIIVCLLETRSNMTGGALHLPATPPATPVRDGGHFGEIAKLLVLRFIWTARGCVANWSLGMITDFLMDLF